MVLHRRGSRLFGLFLTHLTLLSSSSAVLAAPLELSINTEVNAEIGAGQCAGEAFGTPWIHEVMLTSSDGPKFVPAVVQAGIGEVLRFTRRSEDVTVESLSIFNPCSSIRTDDELSWDLGPDGSLNQTLFVVQSLEPQWFSYGSNAKPVGCSSEAVFAINPGSRWTAFAARADMQRGGNVSQPLTTAMAETSSSPTPSRDVIDGNPQ